MNSLASVRSLLALLAIITIVGGAAQSVLAQDDDAAGVKIEPYTGEPILLEEPEAPPEPRIVEPRVKKTTKFEDGSPRIEREVARYSDDSFVSNGSYKEFYQSGQVFVEGNFELGTRVDVWTYYHENGKVAKKVSYKDGVPEGEVQILRDDGTLKAKRLYKAGKRHGDWLAYDDTGEQVLREQHYVDGKPDGVWKQWYESGKPWRETPFKDGKRHGQATEWREDGSKRAEVNFKEGLRDGLTISWSASGEKVEQRFEAGKRILDDK